MGKTTKDRRDTRDDDAARYYMADARPWYVPTPSARTLRYERRRALAAARRAYRRADRRRPG